MRSRGDGNTINSYIFNFEIQSFWREFLHFWPPCMLLQWDRTDGIFQIVRLNVLTNTRVLSAYNWETQSFLRDCLDFGRAHIATRSYRWDLWLTTSGNILSEKTCLKTKKKNETKATLLGLGIVAWRMKSFLFLVWDLTFLFFSSTKFFFQFGREK